MDEFDVMRALRDLKPIERKRVLEWGKSLNDAPFRASTPPPTGNRMADQRAAIGRAFSPAPSKKSRKKVSAAAEKKILRYCPKLRYSTTRAIAKRAGFSPTYTRWGLKSLLEQKKIEKRGLGRSTSYRKAQKG